VLADFVAAMTRHICNRRPDTDERPRHVGGKGAEPRTGRNPATGETIQIKASKKVDDVTMRARNEACGWRSRWTRKTTAYGEDRSDIKILSQAN
jgi:hypothetical protein